MWFSKQQNRFDFMGKTVCKFGKINHIFIYLH